MKKPKIEVPPMPKARINPGLLGLAALGVAGAFYYFNYMQKPVAVAQVKQPEQVKTVALNPGVPVKI